MGDCVRRLRTSRQLLGRARIQIRREFEPSKKRDCLRAHGCRSAGTRGRATRRPVVRNGKGDTLNRQRACGGDALRLLQHPLDPIRPGPPRQRRGRIEIRICVWERRRVYLSRRGCQQGGSRPQHREPFRIVRQHGRPIPHTRHLYDLKEVAGGEALVQRQELGGASCPRNPAGLLRAPRDESGRGVPDQSRELCVQVGGKPVRRL
mmetsp:Transcript_674/g.1870  ORF Transcript_674/g.1870 Transcript_674/m.1870 type:complete len:206 (+) Transcript_674:839-1456(+)